MNLLVYRDCRRAESSVALRRALEAEVSRLAGAASPEATQRLAEGALLRAGEIESLLADAGACRAGAAAAIADRLADLAVGLAGPIPPVPPDLVAELPASVRPSPPESFAYYALQPQSFARLAGEIAAPSGAAAVIGIRTIGATLSAMVASALRLRGVRAERLTARPGGHPYARTLEPGPAMLAFIDEQRGRRAAFFVVDEGPGMSGSSFLAVAEALARAGVDPRSITLLGTRAADPCALFAEDAPSRFAAFAGLRVAPPAPPPEGAAVDVSAGAWRGRTWADQGRWPATWPAIERVKHLSADGGLLKFEGLGRWGAAVRARAQAVADAGFGPPPADVGAGFVRYPMLAGLPLARGDRDRALVERLADYCAFRAAAFPAPDADAEPLRAMVRWNTSVLLGRNIELALPVPRPVIADARLHPHEWIASADGRALKVDAAAHGDDHLYPGPADIAWDLAGAVVEWELDGEARAAFLARYARASGDRAADRLPDYLVAYTVAQLARAEMAAGAHGGTPEAARWLRESGRYHAWMERCLKEDRP